MYGRGARISSRSSPVRRSPLTPDEFFVGIGDINAAHLGPAKPLVPTPTAPPADKPSDIQGPQSKELQEQIEARPLKRKLEEALEHKKDTGAPSTDPAPKESEAQPEAEVIEEELLLRNDDTELELIEAVCNPRSPRFS